MTTLHDRILAIKGIGMSKARRLYEAFGDDLTGLDEHNPNTLSTLCDILGVALSERFLCDLREHRNLYSLLHQMSTSSLASPHKTPHHQHPIQATLLPGSPVFFSCLSFDEMERVSRVFGANAFATLTTTPHHFLPLLPWGSCERVWRCLPGDPACTYRLSGAVETALLERLDTGKTKARQNEMTPIVAGLLRICANHALVHQAFDLAVDQERIERQDGVLQIKGVAVMARTVKAQVLALSANPSFPEHDQGRIHQAIQAACSPQTGVDTARPTLTPEQQQAVSLPFATRFSLLAGYAGSGKTTVLACIADAAEALGITAHLLALAGRAAQRMSTLTGRPARTIASFLIQQQNRPTMGPDDLVIIDESSMVDLTTLWRVLHVLGPARLMMVGDPAQLPPIGYGRTFHAFVDWPEVPKTILDRVHRQGAETGIPAVAEAIRHGHMPTLPDFPFDATRCPAGVYRLSCTPSKVLNTILSIQEALYAWGVHPDDVQILTPVHRGAAGTQAVHAGLHARQRARTGRRPAFAGRDDLDIGSPVMWTENNWDRDLTNGSLGRLLHKGPLPHSRKIHDNKGNVLDLTGIRGFPHLPPFAGSDVLAIFDGTAHHLKQRDAFRLAPASSLTIHKAQGSQWRVNVILLTYQHKYHEMLYTACTRSTQLSILLYADLHKKSMIKRRES